MPYNISISKNIINRKHFRDSQKISFIFKRYCTQIRTRFRFRCCLIKCIQCAFCLNPIKIFNKFD